MARRPGAPWSDAPAEVGSARDDRARSVIRVAETSLDFFRKQRGACQNSVMPTSPAPPLRAILMPTYSKYERYVDECTVAVDTFWPGHPDLWVLTDQGHFRYARSVVVRSPQWVGVVAGSIEELLAQGALTRADRVLLLIEDHVQSRRCGGPMSSGRARSRRGAT